MPEIDPVEVAQIVVLCAIAEDTWDVQVIVVFQDQIYYIWK